jgi:hypothetical protein
MLSLDDAFPQEAWWKSIACTTTSTLRIVMFDFWYEGASSISFHPRVDLSSLPHSAYYKQRFYAVQRVWVTSFTSPLTSPEAASHEAGRS